MKEFPTPPSIESLQSQLSSLGISEPLPVFPDSNPTTNPVDVYRCYIAETLAPIGGVDIKLIYTSLEWTQSFDKGDLILAIPRLRLKGKKPDEVAKEWAEKVSSKKIRSLLFKISVTLKKFICYSILLRQAPIRKKREKDNLIV